MGFGDNLGGLGEQLNNLKNEHGDKINEGADSLQEQHSDKLGEHAGAANDFIDGLQTEHLGQEQPTGEQQAAEQAESQENQ
ncbi:Rv0909 family putative TA system antitoxin [Neomicrococcus lactis]